MKTPEQNKSQEEQSELPYERPFEYLKHSSDTIVKNWYQARKYVLDLLNCKLQSLNTLPKRWHFIVDGDSELMLSVARHLALYAHFCNYEEYDIFGKLSCKNRTKITIISSKNAEEIETELLKEDLLGNLPKYCIISVFGNVKNEDSYLDIYLDIVKSAIGNIDDSSCITIKISEEDVEKFITSKTDNEIYRIDTRKAIYTSKIYDFSKDIRNIPYEDINCIERYNKALYAFQSQVLDSDKQLQLINREKWENSLSTVRSNISNVFCADCFEIHQKEMHLIADGKKSDAKKWGNHILISALAHSEHNRWLAEKLILGFEPYGRKEKIEYARLFGMQRKEYSDQLKNRLSSPMHINLCSNKELRRIDPDNMKYDSFLMLAIPLILSHV